MTSAVLTDPRTGRRTPGDPELRQRDERLEALKAVVGKLAHDFNNLLAPQYGYITLLKDEVASGSTQAAYATAMEAAALKTEGYIASILVGMRPHRHFAPRDFELHQLLREFVDLWRTEPRNGTQIESEIEPAIFWGDEKQWRIVFDQLFANARYALAMGGKLSIALRRQTLRGEEVERLGLGTNDVFCVDVSDNGFGMKGEVARRAFEPFFTTRTHEKAPGLGLTIVHGIVLFHGGQVELASAEDRGTTVTLWIPAARMHAADSLDAMKPASTARKKALLVADDPLIKEVLRSWLAEHQLETDTATNEKEARRSLERARGNCAVIICEADLKSGRGEEIYNALASAGFSCPWVFLSAGRTPEFARGSGREDPLVMKKPFSHTAFSEVVRKYANR
jgi:nitrogen-specific signal transduction histidine kinase/CheY-like chemotaxis protein